jgi:hypothetical protein
MHEIFILLVDCHCLHPWWISGWIFLIWRSETILLQMFNLLLCPLRLFENKINEINEFFFCELNLRFPCMPTYIEKFRVNI